LNAEPGFVLTLSCPDTPGIVHAVSGFLLERGCNILDSQQHGDEPTRAFTMRIHFAAPSGARSDVLQDEFAPVAARFGMTSRFSDLAVKPRVLIMVSKHDHCLNDLLYRYRKGALRIDIPAVVSNHRDSYQLVASHGIPFEHLPVRRREVRRRDGAGGAQQQRQQQAMHGLGTSGAIGRPHSIAARAHSGSPPIAMRALLSAIRSNPQVPPSAHRNAP